MSRMMKALEQLYEILARDPRATGFWLLVVSVVIGVWIMAITEYNDSRYRRDEAAAEKRAEGLEIRRQIRRANNAVEVFRRHYATGSGEIMATWLRDKMRVHAARRQEEIDVEVRVTQGRWKGRVGTLMGEHRNEGSPGGQQGQAYPVVELHPVGKAKKRTVRVLAVERVA